MKFAFKFEYGSRFQRFEFRTFENSFSISRISNKTYSERWYALKTHASLSVDDASAYRSSSEFIGFTMGKTFQRFLSRDARQSLADSRWDDVYNYEEDLNQMAGDGNFIAHRADGSYVSDPETAWAARSNIPPF